MRSQNRDIRWAIFDASTYPISHMSAMIDSISLPSPRPLLPLLLQAGFNHEIAAEASRLYQQRAEEFRQHTETTLTIAWQKIATLPAASASMLDPLTRKDISTFTNAYLRYLGEWKEEVIQILGQTSKSKAASPRCSHPFNHEYVPLLEHFFEENPFPTHADKVFLAKKSNMHYKQIHVWFQNRRSRAKRVVKPLRKKCIFGGAMKPLDKLCGYVVRPVSQTPQSTQPSLPSGDGQHNPLPCALTLPPPRHAFPSPYPPTCPYDPFPCTSGKFSFGKPGWMRMPCSEPLLSDPITIDDLVGKFSQLHVRDDSCAKGSCTPSSHAATTAITVIPSRAPHPSSIAPKRQEFAQVVVRYPAVRASTPRSHAFQSSSLISTPATLIPHGTEPLAKRRTASSSQCFPGRMENDRRDTMPSARSSTSSPSLSAGLKSRSCSLSSVGSLRT